MEPPSGCSSSSLDVGQWKPGMTFGDFAEVCVHHTSREGPCCRDAHEENAARPMLVWIVFLLQATIKHNYA